MSIIFDLSDPNFRYYLNRIYEIHGRQNFEHMMQNRVQISEKLLYGTDRKFFYQALSYIRHWKIKILISRPIQPIMLKKIGHINFQYLKYLSLQFSRNPNNIESISWINCPVIQIIKLNGIQITSLKAVGKTNFKFLRSLQLNKNLYNNYQIIYLNRMHSKGLVKLLLFDFDFNYEYFLKRQQWQNNTPYSMIPLMKLQSSALESRIANLSQMVDLSKTVGDSFLYNERIEKQFKNKFDKYYVKYT